MRHQLGLISLALIALAIMAACSRASAPEPSLGNAPSAAPAVPAPAPRPPVAAPAPAPADKALATSVAQELTLGRMVVRTSTVAITVHSVAEAIDQVKAIAESVGGYMVSSTWDAREVDRKATVSIRVPSEKYDDTLRKVRALAVEVLSENSQTQDVTEEFTDLQSRLRNLEASEKEYLRLLQRANTVEDVLKVQQQLANVRGDIERTKGRIQFLERTTSTSLIAVSLEKARAFKAAFTADRIQVEEGESVAFTNQSAGGEAPFGYLWDFGDGTTSTERNPVHSYNSGGSYTVSLRVTDAKGNSSVEAKSDYIKVLFPPGWAPGSTAKDAWSGLRVVARGLGNLAIWVGIFAPIWGPVWLIVWYVRRRQKRARQAQRP